MFLTNIMNTPQYFRHFEEICHFYGLKFIKYI